MKPLLLKLLAAIALLPAHAIGATCTVRVLVDIPADNSSGDPYRDHGAFRKGQTDDAQYYEHGSFGAEGGDTVPVRLQIDVHQSNVGALCAGEAHCALISDRWT